MSMTMEKRKMGEKEESEAMPDFIREAIEDRDALAHILSKKALETRDEKKGAFYYLMASFLRNGEIRPFNKLLATDGKNFYVGPLYPLAKKKYGEKIVPFLWMHEVMHIIHAHPSRMRIVPDPELYNIVADLYINNLLENRLEKIPDDFVTLSSFLKFIVDERGAELTKEEKKALLKLADLVVKEKITVEEAYAVIEKIEVAKREFKEKFRKSSFFGKDMGDEKQFVAGGCPGGKTGTSEEGAGKRAGGIGKREASKGTKPSKGARKNADTQGAGGEESRKMDESKGGAGAQEEEKRKKQGEGGGSTEPSEKKGKEEEKERGGEGESTEKTDKYEPERFGEELKKLRREINRLFDEVKRTIGEFNALRRVVGAPPGSEEGVFGRAEYRELNKLRVELEKEFLDEIGKEVAEYEANYSRFSDDAYWLPEDREIRKSKILVFLDTSGSIPEPIMNLFMNWVNKAVKKYNIEADVVVFAVGVLEKKKASTTRKLKNVAMGGGTRWDRSVAREIIRAKREEVPLMVVLSDFDIDVTREAWEAIRIFKKNGGKISCWSVDTSLPFCDKLHRFPRSIVSVLP
jgi:predicted metal-dependent peptidase